MNNKDRISQNKLWLFLSFLEGGSVMICELVSAKLLAPYFGTSLSVWAAVLGLTLGGLTSGYYMGGLVSKKYAKNELPLLSLLIIAGILLALMPFTATFVMETTLNLSLEWGAILSLSLFMVPPLICMGMVSPLIINLLTTEANSAGNSAGNVYAISTLGGIIATFLSGFYLIPEFGLTIPCVVMGIILAVIPGFMMIKRKIRVASAAIILMVVAVLLSFRQKDIYNDEYKVIYQSEGIMGQVKVVDHPSYAINEPPKPGRALIVNNTLQTYVDLEHNMENSLWVWSHYFPAAASIYPEGSKVLLLGLGGGTQVKQLAKLGFDVDVVEIDERIVDISKKYFNLDPNTKIFIDDARHYIRKSEQKYDIIIYDTFLSESVPEHLLTMEGFRDAKKILNKDGMIMVNFYGAINGDQGRAAKSVIKTFNKSNLKVNILATPGPESNRNLIFLASTEEKDYSKIRFQSNYYSKIDKLKYFFLDNSDIDYSRETVLLDQKPKLSKMYMKVAKGWKKGYNDYYHKYFRKK